MKTLIIENMKRYNTTALKEAENHAIDAFLADVVAVCKMHGLSLSHEDGHGAFEVANYDESKTEWLMDAHDATHPNKMLGDIINEHAHDIY